MKNDQLTIPCYPGAPTTTILPRLKWRVIAWDSGHPMTFTNTTQAGRRSDYLNARRPADAAGQWEVLVSPASRVRYVVWCPAALVEVSAEWSEVL